MTCTNAICVLYTIISLHIDPVVSFENFDEWTWTFNTFDEWKSICIFIVQIQKSNTQLILI